MSESTSQAIKNRGGAVRALRNSPARPAIFPVTPEFTNWRSEQQAWRDSVALLDQSHHMCDLFISGPDALRLLSDTAVNNFANFPVNSAKQFVAVNHEGYLIGDAIIVRESEDKFDIIGWFMVIDWVQFIGETGGYDVTFERDDNSVMRAAGKDPVLYRYEVQGPRALALMEAVTGEPVPDTKFFGMHTFTIAGKKVNSIRHGMAGQPGFELFGPYGERDAVRQAIIDAGEKFDLVLVGARAYSTANLESAWVPAPFAAIFTGERMDEYLEWLPANRMGSIAGSYDSADIESFYLTPFEIGYGKVINYEHDFIGKDALLAKKDGPHRQKVTLVWSPEDVSAVQRSMYEPGLAAKFIEFPKARYGLYQMDRIEAGGKAVGISLDAGYIYNEKAFVSLAVIDPEFAEPGTQVEVLWGEDPNSTKPNVEPHRQVRIRATVEPAPYSSFARENYRSNK